jgi:hypothetical protein
MYLWTLELEDAYDDTIQNVVAESAADALAKLGTWEQSKVISITRGVKVNQ